MKARKMWNVGKGGCGARQSILVSAAIAAAVVSSTACAGFIFDEGKIMSSEQGTMGKYQPYEAQGKATFETPNGSMEPKQDRYKDAVLMVDLAYTPLSQRGSGEPAIVRGYGDNLPFDDAVTMIMPTGWHLYRDKLLEQKSIPESVSYTGGVPWPDVFKQIGGRYGLHFHIDWFDRTVLISKGRITPAMRVSNVRVIPEPGGITAPKPAITSLSSTSAPSAVVATPGSSPMTVSSKSFASPTSTAPAVVTVPGSGPSMATVPTTSGAAVPVAANQYQATLKPAVSAPTSIAPAVQSWDAKVGQSLRGVIIGWSKRVGYDVHWTPENLDYPIDSPLHFEGNYEQAIESIFHLYDNAERPFVVSGSRPGKRLNVAEDLSKSKKSPAL